MAPSSHNTQPWRFSFDEQTIELYRNRDRWLKVADSDRRELHLSLGCALENLIIAADRRLFRDPSFRRELGMWIGRGVFGDSWLRRQISKFAVTYFEVGEKRGEQGH